MTGLRALTVRQPWAGLLAAGVKPVENRTWRTSARGELWLHAGAGADPIAEWMYGHLIHAENTAGAQIWARGAVIALAELTGVHRDTGCCEPWGQPDQWHWEIRPVRVLAVPVPARGALGIWQLDAGLVDSAARP